MTVVAADTFVEAGDVHSVLDLIGHLVSEGPGPRIGFEDGWHTWAEVDELSDRCAEFFRQLGLAEGDRVAGLLNNDIDHVVSWLATTKIGAVFSPVNTSYQKDWLRHQLVDVDPKLIVADAEFAERLRDVWSDLPAGATLLYTGQPDTQEQPSPTPKVVAFEGYRSCERLETRFVPAADTISHIIYTSGTTGRSKGCLISHGYLLSYARERLVEVPRLSGEASFTPLPLFHLAGLGSTIGSLYVGGDAYLARRFSLSKFWSEIESSGASYVQLIGAMAPMIAKAADSDEARRCFGQIRTLTGSAVPEINDALHTRFGVQNTYIKFYGQTEACPIATTNGQVVTEGAVGVPSAVFDVQIVDESDRPVPVGTVGHIVCRPLAPHVMFAGYWRNPEATVAKSTSLWWHTGDFGRFDEQGSLFFADRGDDRLRKSGENVSSYEVEAVVSAHPEVASVACYAVPAAIGEDDIKLTVVRREGSALSTEELWRWCIGQLPKFAVPRYIEFRTELPSTPTGKIQKHVLRSEGITHQTWDSSDATTS